MSPAHAELSLRSGTPLTNGTKDGTIFLSSTVSNWLKILEAARRRPQSVRLADAIVLAGHFGFVRRAGGKHANVLKRPGFDRTLNFQDAGAGLAKRYQVQQPPGRDR